MYDKLHKTVSRGADKHRKHEYDTLIKIKGILEEQKKHIRFCDWDGKEVRIP